MDVRVIVQTNLTPDFDPSSCTVSQSNVMVDKSMPVAERKRHRSYMDLQTSDVFYTAGASFAIASSLRSALFVVRIFVLLAFDLSRTNDLAVAETGMIIA